MKIFLISMLCMALFLVACQPQITSFEECFDAGKPIVESFPRQCQADDNFFVEPVSDDLIGYI